MCSLFLLTQSGEAWAQLRIVSFNTLGNPRTGTAEVYTALGVESVNGIARAPDIITLQEQSSGVTANHLALLNSLYGANTYAATTLFGAGDTTHAIFYRTASVQLIGQELIGTSSTSGQPRQGLRAEFRPVGYDSSADFYVYNSHFKSSDSSADSNRRNAEAITMRENADALGAGQHILYTGDFNFYRSSDPAFQTLTSAGNAQAFDPINRVGSWHDNASFLDTHTQNPRAGTNQGGVDDRFDWQLATAAFLDKEGLSYIGGSYHAFGNTGTHQLNGSITSGSAAALAERLPGYTESQAAGVLSALASASDHLPVVADYQLPARMGVTAPLSLGPVISGASVNVTFTVANTAGVVAANGADELDYSYYAVSGLSGAGSGMDMALGGGNNHSLTLLTGGGGGERTGVFEVESSSQSVAEGFAMRTVEYTVLDHAQASFSEFTTQTSKVADFGLLTLASGPITLDAEVYNLIAPSGFTTGLDLDEILVSGDSTLFSLSLMAFEGLDAGQAVGFEVAFLGAVAPGSYSAVYQFLVSDEDLPGAAILHPLTFTVLATVIPEPQVVLLALGGLVFLMLQARHRRPHSSLMGR